MLSNNALVEGGLPDGVFEDLTRLNTLRLSNNPGGASFVPRADAGEDLVLHPGETATLGGPGTGGGPWGTNVDYAWVEVDAQGNPVASADRTDGLSAADVEKPGFTAPVLTEERVLRYRFTVIGKGVDTSTNNHHSATDTVTVTVRAAPAVTAVALTSAPQGGGRYATAPAPGNAATVQVVVVNPPFIVKWDEDAYTVTEGEDVEATVTLRTAAGVPKPRNDYHVALISVGDSAVAGDDYPDVSLTLAVPPADWMADGAGFAASVPVSVATVNDSDVEADERFYLAVASSIGQLPLGLDCPAELPNVVSVVRLNGPIGLVS